MTTRNPAVATSAPRPRLEIRNASKTFGRSKVLERVSFSVEPGEIHGLVGQNGSGKSTVLKLLSGFHSSDPGTEFLVDGSPLDLPVHPRRLRELGVSFVHQDLGLDDRGTVLDNVRVGRFSVNRLTRNIRFAHEAAEVARTLGRLGSHLDPRALVGSLSPTERSLVAVARALQNHTPGGGCIVFDESTQSLPREALEEFYGIVRDLAAEGVSVLIVSHRLDEILQLTDTVSVLRDGRLVETLPTASTSERGLTRSMLARDAELEPLTTTVPTTPGNVLVRVDGVSADLLAGASFEVRSGAVVGVTGQPESGYDELPALLAGARRATAGAVTVGDTRLDLRGIDVRRAGAAGIGYIPKSRAREGLALTLSQVENLTVPQLRARSGPFWMTREWQLRAFQDAVHAFGLTPQLPNEPAAILSGGNQQKLLLAKILALRPRVLVAHEPTQAVDIGARRDILGALRRAAADGAAVVIVSGEADDLASACDRVLIFEKGVVARELTGPLGAHEILDAVYPGLDQIAATA